MPPDAPSIYVASVGPDQRFKTLKTVELFLGLFLRSSYLSGHNQLKFLRLQFRSDKRSMHDAPPLNSIQQIRFRECLQAVGEDNSINYYVTHLPPEFAEKCNVKKRQASTYSIAKEILKLLQSLQIDLSFTLTYKAL